MDYVRYKNGKLSSHSPIIGADCWQTVCPRQKKSSCMTIIIIIIIQSCYTSLNIMKKKIGQINSICHHQTCGASLIYFSGISSADTADNCLELPV